MGTSMKIEDFFAAINVELVFTHYDDNRVTVSGRSCETQEGCILRSDYGSGSTRKKALADYAVAISGKRLVVNPRGGCDRREYIVPSLLPKLRVVKKKKAKKKAKKS